MVIFNKFYADQSFTTMDKEQAMKSLTARFIWLALYPIAMALLEVVVVAYIRGLYADGQPPQPYVPYHTMEIWREVATLVMLFAVGWLGGRRRTEQPGCCIV